MAKRPITPEDLLRIVFVGDPQISPDGERVLFTHKTINDKNKYITNLFSVDMQGTLQQWTQGEGGAGNGRWSPDGAQIAFISGRDKPASQIYLLSVGGGEARKLTNLPEGRIGGFKWSPDGRMIAFTFREQLPYFTEKAKKEREEKGLSDPAIEIDDIWYRLDGDGYFAGQRYGLYVLLVENGEFVPVGGVDGQGKASPYRGAADGNYTFDWSPDSTELAVVHSASSRPFVDPPNDQVYRLRLDGTVTMLPGLPKGEKTEPRWSPDGKSIAYAGDVDEQDPWGTRNTKLYLVPADGGEARDLSGHQDFDLAVTTLSDVADAAFGARHEWSPDGRGLYVQVGTRGETQVGFVSVDGGVELLTEGRATVQIGNVSRRGRRVAAVVGKATRLPEVAVVEPELGTGRLIPKVLTGLNLAFHDEIELVEPKEIWLDSTEGAKLHGWYMLPPGATGNERLPACLNIHGGPHTQYGWAFFHELQVQAANGYVVVYTNPRGSKGYGEAWTSAIRGDWGVRDWEDIQTATRWMKEQPFVNPDKMAVMGGSYGGYMTNWTIGHTDEFACAITDRCVSNMVSMAGNSDFPFNKDGYFKGHPDGDLEAIRELWRQSPLAYFDKVKTPTLVIHSVGDLRCNVEQGEQVFHSLQMRGIPSRFVRYPVSTSHGLSRSGPPDLRLHRLGEYLGWLSRFLG